MEHEDYFYSDSCVYRDWNAFPTELLIEFGLRPQDLPPIHIMNILLYQGYMAISKSNSDPLLGAIEFLINKFCLCNFETLRKLQPEWQAFSSQ